MPLAQNLTPQQQQGLAALIEAIRSQQNYQGPHSAGASGAIYDAKDPSKFVNGMPVAGFGASTAAMEHKRLADMNAGPPPSYQNTYDPSQDQTYLNREEAYRTGMGAPVIGATPGEQHSDRSIAFNDSTRYKPPVFTNPMIAHLEDLRQALGVNRQATAEQFAQDQSKSDRQYTHDMMQASVANQALGARSPNMLMAYLQEYLKNMFGSEPQKQAQR